jgi:hypothetical protein
MAPRSIGTFMAPHGRGPADRGVMRVRGATDELAAMYPEEAHRLSCWATVPAGSYLPQDGAIALVMLLEVWTVVLALPVRVPMTGLRSRVLGTGLLSHAPSMLGGRARYSQVPCHSSVVTQGLSIIPLRCRHRGPAASAAGGKEASSGIVPGPSIRPAQVPVPALPEQGRDGTRRAGTGTIPELHAPASPQAVQHRAFRG